MILTHFFYFFIHVAVLGDVSTLNNRIDMSGSARYIRHDSTEENGLHVKISAVVGKVVA